MDNIEQITAKDNGILDAIENKDYDKVIEIICAALDQQPDSPFIPDYLLLLVSCYSEKGGICFDD